MRKNDRLKLCFYSRFFLKFSSVSKTNDFSKTCIRKDEMFGKKGKKEISFKGFEFFVCAVDAGESL